MRAVTAAAVAAVVVLAIAAPVGAAGSPKLVKNINPNGSSFPTSLTQVGNTLFFAANDGVHGTELWKSDGLGLGLSIVRHIVELHGGEITAFSDGTGRGTVRVTNIINWAYDTSYGLEMPLAPVAIGARLFFFNLTCCMGTSEAYVTDGTSTGTKRRTSQIPAMAAMATRTATTADSRRSSCQITGQTCGLPISL